MLLQITPKNCCFNQDLRGIYNQLKLWYKLKSYTMKNAAIIARVSTAIQSFDRQLIELKTLAKEMGYNVAETAIYAEKVSGFKEAKIGVN